MRNREFSPLVIGEKKVLNARIVERFGTQWIIAVSASARGVRKYSPQMASADL